jgi:hypothetical protein
MLGRRVSMVGDRFKGALVLAGVVGAGVWCGVWTWRRWALRRSLQQTYEVCRACHPDWPQEAVYAYVLRGHYPDWNDEQIFDAVGRVVGPDGRSD